MRVSTHNGKGKANHNDRRKVTEEMENEHIDPNLSQQNFYWCCNGNKSFAEAEEQFYEDNYEEYLKRKNKSNKRHCRPLETYRDLSRKHTVETILQVGNRDDYQRVKNELGEKMAIQLYRDILRNTFMRFVTEMEKRYRNLRPITMAIHVDEPNGTPHCHFRYNLYDPKKMAKEQSLAEMEIDRPYPNRPEGRYNNRQITFDRAMRALYIEKLEEVIMEYGREKETIQPILDEMKKIEKTPLAGRKHMAHNDYVISRQREKIDKNRDTLKKQKTRFDEMERKIEYAEEFTEFVQDQEAEYEREMMRGKSR